MKVAISIVILCWVFGSNNSFCYWNDYVEWSEQRKLQWIDFQGIPDSASRFSASCVVSIRLDYKLGKRKIRQLKVTSRFSKRNSWHMDTTVYGLNHEQRHFDLAEIYARRLKAALIEKKNSIGANNQQEIISLYNSYRQMLIDDQDRYDTETNGGLNMYRQQDWNENIDKELDKLKM